jgi:hypothetical protein
MMIICIWRRRILRRNTARTGLLRFHSGVCDSSRRRHGDRGWNVVGMWDPAYCFNAAFMFKWLVGGFRMSVTAFPHYRHHMVMVIDLFADDFLQTPSAHHPGS